MRLTVSRPRNPATTAGESLPSPTPQGARETASLRAAVAVEAQAPAEGPVSAQDQATLFAEHATESGTVDPVDQKEADLGPAPL